MFPLSIVFAAKEAQLLHPATIIQSQEVAFKAPFHVTPARLFSPQTSGHYRAHFTKRKRTMLFQELEAFKIANSGSRDHDSVLQIG